jgi:hypothetical protein
MAVDTTEGVQAVASAVVDALTHDAAGELTLDRALAEQMLANATAYLMHLDGGPKVARLLRDFADHAEAGPTRGHA